MMKARFYLAMAAAALLMTNCSQDEALNQSQNQGSTNTLTATIEGASRSSVSDGGVFKWAEDDKIAVGNADGSFTEFVSNANGVFTSTDKIVPTGYAIYPYNTAPQSLPQSVLPTITLPSEYSYGSTNAPMLATITEGEASLQFKHLAGLMRFKVKNVPQGATTFTLTADKKITGTFTPTGSEPSISTSEASNTNNKVSITFDASSENRDMDFYIPMPVGTYTSLTVSLSGGTLNNCSLSSGVTNEITRGKLLLMPTLVCDGTTLKKERDEDSSIVSLGQEPVNLDVNDGDKVVVEMDGVEATLNLKAPSSTTESNELTISDGSTDDTTSSATSNGTLNVSAENASSLTIDAPTLTVKLTSGNYETVTAKTAQNTLIIGSGVTIGELIVVDGNVEIKEGATVNSRGAAVSSLEELKTALEDGAIKTISLKNNIVSNEIVYINRAVTLDLNKKTFSCTVDRFIRVQNSTSNENAETIKNGTISNGVSGGRCVETRSGNINLTLENLTLKTTASSGWNQPFTIGGNGTNITVDITDCTIDAGAPGYGITTFNPVVMTIENTTISGYSALNIKEADESEGSKNSIFNIINSTLESINNASTDETNNFTTVMIEDDYIEINVDATSKLSAKANNNNQSIFCIGNEVISEAITGVKVTVKNGATLTLDGNNTYIFAINHKQVLGDNVFKFPANYAGQLNSEGYKTETENDLVKVVAVCEAKVGDVLYETLSSAIEDASENDVVTLIKNVVIPANTVIPDGVTIDGANKSVSTNTGSGVNGAGKGVFQLVGGTIKNVIFDSPNTQYDIIVTAAGSIIEGCEFKTASQVVDANGTALGKRAIYTAGTSDIEGVLQVTDCIFDDQVYAFNFSNDKNKMDIKFDNCTLGGWLSGYGKSHTFTKCTFKESGGYKNYIPYCPVTFNQCAFLDDFTISLKKGSTYTFDENCTYSSYPVEEPGNLTWDFSGGTVGVGDNEISETVTIGTKSWENNVGEGGTPDWNEVSQ